MKLTEKWEQKINQRILEEQKNLLENFSREKQSLINQHKEELENIKSDFEEEKLIINQKLYASNAGKNE